MYAPYPENPQAQFPAQTSLRSIHWGMQLTRGRERPFFLNITWLFFNAIFFALKYWVFELIDQDLDDKLYIPIVVCKILEMMDEVIIEVICSLLDVASIPILIHKGTISQLPIF